jgi:hypothetical protein
MSESGIQLHVDPKKVRGRYAVSISFNGETKCPRYVDPFKPDEVEGFLAAVKQELPGLNGEADQFRKIILSLANAKPKKPKAVAKAMPPDPSGKPSILAPGGHTTDKGQYIEIGNDLFTREAIAALPAGAVFRRSTIPGEVVGEKGSKYFSALTNEALRIIVDKNMRLQTWVTAGKGENRHQVLVFEPTSRDRAALIVSAAGGDPRVPELKWIGNYPIYTKGFNLSAPGFHDGIMFDEPYALHGLQPEMDPEVICQVLDDFVTDFPWRDTASRQNYYGLCITVLIRSALSGNIPFHLVLATLERTGKTKLIEEGIGGIFLGRKTPAQQMSTDDNEVDKRIISMLLRGDTLLHLDNIKEFMDSPSFASLFTSTTYQGRVLGSSKMVDLPNNLIGIGSGNNVRATGEIVKRTVPIQLQPTTDAPELRTDFVHPDFFGYVQENRRLILSCLIGMVELWKRNGCPRGKVPMGGFDDWAAVVGGILANVGYTEWMTNAREWRQKSDPRGADLRTLVEEWNLLYRRQPVSVDTLLAIAHRLDLFPDILAGKTEKALQTSFGMRVLARNIDTPVGDFVLRKSSDSRPATYFLEKESES